MASADYRLCDVCEEKTFYDANLNYDWPTKDRPLPPEEVFRIAGEPQPHGMKLDWLGDWAVICADCAKTHKTIVVPVAEPKKHRDG